MVRRFSALTALFLSFLLAGCGGILSELSPETVAYLEAETEIQCDCINTFSAELESVLEKGDFLLQDDKPIDKSKLSSGPETLTEEGKIVADFIVVTQKINLCKQQQSQFNPAITPDQQFIAGAELQQVLEIKPSDSPKEKMEKLQKVTIEILPKFCADKEDTYLKMQKLSAKMIDFLGAN